MDNEGEQWVRGEVLLLWLLQIISEIQRYIKILIDCKNSLVIINLFIYNFIYYY